MADRIAVVTMGVKLGYEEKGYTRFRTICQMLRQAGYEVDLITTSFQHWEKAQRDRESFPYEMYDFGIVFIDEPGYSRNIDPSRLVSHAVAAKNLTAYLEHAPAYDLVYAEVPPNDVALSAARYAESRGIPFVTDVNDLWPEAMRMVLDVPVVSDVLFSGLEHDAREVYRRASGVVGTSDEYSMRPFSDCDPSTPRKTVYVGNDLDEFDAGAREFSPGIAKPDDEFWVTYAGTLGTSYDIPTLIRASEILEAAGFDDIKVKVLGSGPDEDQLHAQAEGCDCNVEFLGYMPYAQMAAYLTLSDVTVNSLVRKAPQSIVTKVGDYLAAGIPMVNTGSSVEFRDKVIADGFGMNVEAEDPETLAACILALHEDCDMRAEMGRNARHIAETQFDRKSSYMEIVELVDGLLHTEDAPEQDWETGSEAVDGTSDGAVARADGITPAGIEAAADDARGEGTAATADGTHAGTAGTAGYGMPEGA